MQTSCLVRKTCRHSAQGILASPILHPPGKLQVRPTLATLFRGRVFSSIMLHEWEPGHGSDKKTANGANKKMLLVPRPGPLARTGWKRSSQNFTPACRQVFLSTPHLTRARADVLMERQRPRRKRQIERERGTQAERHHTRQKERTHDNPQLPRSSCKRTRA